MNKIIYRKSDLQCVGTILGGLTKEKMIELNVIPNFGGKFEDYEVIGTDKNNFHLELIDGVVTIVDNPIIPIQPQPSQEDYLLDLDYRISKIELGL